MWRRNDVAEPNYLEAAVLPGAGAALVAARMGLHPRDRAAGVRLTGGPVARAAAPWRAIAVTGIFFTSFTIWDLLRRTMYTQLMQWAAISVGAVLIAACLVRLRWRAIA